MSDLQTKISQVLQQLTDSAEAAGGTANDENGIVRQMVSNWNLGFNAWFCICCELADRSARREGFKNQYDRAFAKIAKAETERAEVL